MDKTPQEQAEEFFQKIVETVPLYDCRKQFVGKLTDLIQAKAEREDAIKNAIYWKEQAADENEKRGIAEHNLDTALGDKADYVELVERERDQLKKQLEDANLPKVEDVQLVYEITNLKSQIAQLQSVNAELTKDKERLDFMDSQYFTFTVWRRIWSASEIRVVIDQTTKGSK